MKPQRELLPAGPAATSGASSERESTPQSQSATPGAPRRRPQTKIACTSCRRRKSKCDGQRPVCSLCAGMGRTMCEYDAGPDVTRFAALKSKHEELQRRVSLLEELFRLLSTRSEAESIEIIRRMRTANLETDLDDLVKFIKNADLLIQMASTQSEQASASRVAESGPNQTLPVGEFTSLLQVLKTIVSKLDAQTRMAFLDKIRLEIDAVVSSTEQSHLGTTALAKSEPMQDEWRPEADPDVESASEVRGSIKRLLNDEPDGMPN